MIPREPSCLALVRCGMGLTLRAINFKSYTAVTVTVSSATTISSGDCVRVVVVAWTCSTVFSSHAVYFVVVGDAVVQHCSDDGKKRTVFERSAFYGRLYRTAAKTTTTTYMFVNSLDKYFVRLLVSKLNDVFCLSVFLFLMCYHFMANKYV